MKTKMLFLSLILLLAFGCDNTGDLSKEDNTTNPETSPVYPNLIDAVDISPAPQGECAWNYLYLRDLKDSVYIINSQEIFSEFISCDESHQTLDFSGNTVLFVQGHTPQSPVNRTYKLIQLSQDNFQLEIDVEQGLLAMPGSWRIALSIPKITPNATLSLTVNLFPEYITPVLIAQGELHGNGKEEFSRGGVVIKTDSEWEAFKQKINTTNNVADTYFTGKEIDFSTDQIIAVFDEVKGSGGWSIDITGITELQDKILISVTNLKKGGGYTVMTQPFQTVKIPVSEKEIEFDFDLAESDNIKNEDCTWNTLEPVLLPENLNIKLNTVFSEQNQLVKNVAGDTIVFVINNERDFLKICDDQAIISGMDFEKNSIVWGRVLSSSVSDKIDRKQLFECPEYTRYKCDVAIEKCVECWDALGYLYFWDVYPQLANNENIILTVK
jgi:hypothetical protein